MAKKDGLAVDRPEEFLRRERIAQRIGAVALTLFVVAGAAGVFGDGPFARAMQREGPIDLQYERFGRSSSPTLLAISLDANTGDSGRVRFRLDRGFLRDLTLLEVRPSDALLGFDDTSAIFEVEAHGGRGHVELQYKPNRFGVFQTLVTPEHAPPARLWQFIYF